jgi:hypothetical protein
MDTDMLVASLGVGFLEFDDIVETVTPVIVMDSDRECTVMEIVNRSPSMETLWFSDSDVDYSPISQ